MIAYVSGKVMEKDPDRLVVLVGGIGLEVRAPAGTIDSAPGVGEEVSLYTYLHVREDVLQLYGFDSPRARDLFIKLMSVSGFGSQKALSVLSIFPPDRFETVIKMGEADTLTLIPGVGKKSAERLLLEMKDKVGVTAEDFTGVSGGDRFVFQEAAEALMQLGYSSAEAHGALKQFPPAQEKASVEELLQFALKHMSKRPTGD